MAYGTVQADVIGTSVANTSLGAGNASIMKNRIINGAMVISQYNGTSSVSVATSTTYTMDRWRYTVSQSSKLTTQQSSTAPTGFNNSLLATSSAATSLGAGDYFLFNQWIEGFNTADLGWGTASAKTVILSFQVYSSLTGTFGGSFTNSTQDRSYPFSYSIPVANTWTTISVTVAGDTTGTWIGATNGRGIGVWFSLGTGTTYSATAGSWAAGSYYAPTGATSVVGTNGATFYITGVQLEVGSSATGFEYVNYQTSLANCQRYLPIVTGGAGSQPFALGMCYSTTAAVVNYTFKVTPRTRPTGITVVNAGFFSCNQANTGGTACTGIVFSDASLDQAQIGMTGMAGLVAGNATLAFNNTIGGQIIFTGCEL